MKNNKTEWQILPIEDILTPLAKGVIISQGWSPQCEKEPSMSENDWGVLKTTAIQPGFFLENENKKLPKQLVPRPQHEVKEGDLLMTCAGPRNRCGVVCLVRKTRKRLMTSGKMYRFRINDKIAIPEFIEAYLLSQKAWKDIDLMKTGISDSGLNLTHSKFKKLLIPLPSVLTQKKIVSKIEELFTELDKGIENLRLAQQQLKIYRQAVLKWAFEGRLTNENVKDGELPEGWDVVKIEDVTVSLDNKRKPINKEERKKRAGNIPYYGANGQVGWIDDYIFDEPLVCVVEDETFTGREIPFSYKITGKTWVNNHAHVLKPKEHLNIDFLNYQLYYYPFLKLTTGSTGRKKLTKAALSNAPIKICSSKEQFEIVNEIEQRLSTAEKIEEYISQSIFRSETLRKSILDQAFKGNLTK